jgi:predicted RNA methylase
MGTEGYSLSGYGEMIADRVRTDAYMEALRAVIRPGAVVMDIGTGPGIMAVLACQLGAKRVYAIEPSEVIQVAKEIAAANHCADKIEFFEDFSTNITIPARADVIVSDLRGVLPLYAQHIPSIVDARQRFLAPGGTLIGRKDRIWVAVVEAPERYSKIVGPWVRDLPSQDLSPCRRKVVNEIHKMQTAPELLLTSANLWVALDYMSVENSDAQGDLIWTVNRDGTGHGIVIWFDADLADGVGFSNSPGSSVAIYSSIFLPWQEPVHLVAGQTVCVHLQAKLIEEDYFWRWITRIESAARAGEMAAEFDQSVLQGAVLSLEKLHKRASTYIPQLSKEGLLRRRVLDLMDGRVSLEEIARRLAAEFPERFGHWHKALSYAGTISEENSL